jgi:GNAT superfamily N-acetyltransferase
VKVRPLTQADGPVWHALLREGIAGYPSAFLLSLEEVESMSADRQAASLAQGNTYGVLSQTDDLLGFANLHLWSLYRIRHRADIGPFFVSARHHGTGIADFLMEALANAARAGGVTWLDLWVAENNTRARGFYARHGFSPIGRRQDAVRIDGRSETDLMMTRHLDGADPAHLEGARQRR